MQLRITPTLMAIATIFSTMVAAAPAPASDVSVSDESSNLDANILGKSSFKGTATWFKPATEGGDRGACGGKKIGDNSYIVALNSEQYGNMSKDSKYCYREVEITGEKGSVTATVMDACPSCDYGDLDLTPVLFKQVVGDMNKGVGEIKWHFI